MRFSSVTLSSFRPLRALPVTLSLCLQQRASRTDYTAFACPPLGVSPSACGRAARPLCATHRSWQQLLVRRTPVGARMKERGLFRDVINGAAREDARRRGVSGRKLTMVSAINVRRRELAPLTCRRRLWCCASRNTTHTRHHRTLQQQQQHCRLCDEGRKVGSLRTAFQTVAPLHLLFPSSATLPFRPPNPLLALVWRSSALPSRTAGMDGRTTRARLATTEERTGPLWCPP